MYAFPIGTKVPGKALAVADAVSVKNAVALVPVRVAVDGTFLSPENGWASIWEFGLPFA